MPSPASSAQVINSSEEINASNLLNGVRAVLVGELALVGAGESGEVLVATGAVSAAGRSIFKSWSTCLIVAEVLKLALMWARSGAPSRRRKERATARRSKKRGT
eukprot:15468087-Alexandrium_andersonii.AAC.1